MEQQVSQFRRFLKVVFPAELPESLSQIQEDELKPKVLPALTYLMPIEKSIIESLYGLGDGWPYSIDECGRIHKMSVELVLQNKNEAIDKIRAYLEMMYSSHL